MIFGIIKNMCSVSLKNIQQKQFIHLRNKIMPKRLTKVLSNYEKGLRNQGAAGSNQKSCVSGHTDGVDSSFE